jgi:hypothetical protein
MTIAAAFLNDATSQPAVYFDRPDLSAFTLQITTDSQTPIAVASVRIRFPTKIFTVDQVKKVTVTSPDWQPAAAGPYVTLTPSASRSLSASAPLVIALAGVSSTNTAATNDAVQVFAGGEAPSTQIFLMRYPAAAGDLTTAVLPEILPNVIYRTPSDFDTIENVLTLRLTNKDPTSPLVTKSWVGTPTVLLSFVYGDDIGSLTPADPPISDPHSAFNIEVDASATYKDGKQTYEWSSTPPESEATDSTPVWTLQPVPENLAVLGAGSGATAEFRISGLSTAAPKGGTLAYLQFSDFPGYSDCYFALPLSKDEPQPAIVYFDGVPNYVGALGETVTLEWQTVAMARVELQQAGRTIEGTFDVAHGSHGVPIDQNTDFALLAYKMAADTKPAHTEQWTAHVPHARITLFSADRTTVADGSQVKLTWATEFARAAQIRAAEVRGDTSSYDIATRDLAAGSKPYFPMHPTTYTLHVTGQGAPPDRAVDVFVLPRGWAVRRMGFPPNAGQGPVLYATDAGLTLVGGQSDNAVFQSADGTRWSKVAVAEFPARNFAAGCVLGGKLWIMGGLQRSSAPPSVDVRGNDVWRSDDGVSWTQVTAAAPWPARSSFACAAFGGKLWIFGGQDQNRQPLGDVWSSTDGVTWTRVPDGSPRWKARSGAAVTVHQDKLWLFGGLLGDGSVADDLWASADGTTWTQQGSGGMFDDGPGGRQRAALASLGGTTLYLFGGIGATGAPLDDLQLFDGGSWDLGTGPTDWAISSPGCATWRRALWFAGGSDGNAATDAVWSWFSEQAT